MTFEYLQELPTSLDSLCQGSVLLTVAVFSDVQTGSSVFQCVPIDWRPQKRAWLHLCTSLQPLIHIDEMPPEPPLGQTQVSACCCRRDAPSSSLCPFMRYWPVYPLLFCWETQGSRCGLSSVEQSRSPSLNLQHNLLGWPECFQDIFCG